PPCPNATRPCSAAWRLRTGGQTSLRRGTYSARPQLLYREPADGRIYEEKREEALQSLRLVRPIKNNKKPTPSIGELMYTANYTPVAGTKPVKYRTLPVGTLNIAYREAGDPANPKLVLLHGFPSSSHQYRNLIPSLGDRFHVISPDYPGFGDSDLPD